MLVSILFFLPNALCLILAVTNIEVQYLLRLSASWVWQHCAVLIDGTTNTKCFVQYFNPQINRVMFVASMQWNDTWKVLVFYFIIFTLRSAEWWVWQPRTVVDWQYCWALPGKGQVFCSSVQQLQTAWTRWPPNEDCLCNKTIYILLIPLSNILCVHQ